jgi:hypothetical protein
MIVSGDRESEVRCLAVQVGITEIYARRILKINLPPFARKQPSPKHFKWGTASMTPRP